MKRLIRKAELTDKRLDYYEKGKSYLGTTNWKRICEEANEDFIELLYRLAKNHVADYNEDILTGEFTNLIIEGNRSSIIDYKWNQLQKVKSPKDFAMDLDTTDVDLVCLYGTIEDLETYGIYEDVSKEEVEKNNIPELFSINKENFKTLLKTLNTKYLLFMLIHSFTTDEYAV